MTTQAAAGRPCPQGRLNISNQRQGQAVHCCKDIRRLSSHGHLLLALLETDRASSATAWDSQPPGAHIRPTILSDKDPSSLARTSCRRVDQSVAMVERDERDGAVFSGRGTYQSSTSRTGTATGAPSSRIHSWARRLTIPLHPPRHPRRPRCPVRVRPRPRRTTPPIGTRTTISSRVSLAPSVRSFVRSLIDRGCAAEFPASSAAPSSSSAAPSATDVALADTAPSTTSISVPSGWEARTRATDFYTVPVIVAASVLLAILIVVAIFSTVCWRNKRRRTARAARKQDAEKSASASSFGSGASSSAATRPGTARSSLDVPARSARASMERHRASPKVAKIDTLTAKIKRKWGFTPSSTAAAAKALAAKQRRRRQHERRVADNDSDISADDGISTATGVSVLADRAMRSIRHRQQRRTVDDDDEVDSDDERMSLTAASASSAGVPSHRRGPRRSGAPHHPLERVESDTRSIRSEQSALSYVAAPPSLPTSSSFGAGLPHHAPLDLPRPNPPAYRASSTLMRDTSRGSPSVPTPNGCWPIAGASTSSGKAVAYPPASPVAMSTSVPALELPGEDATLMSGHIATDDKSILAQRRELLHRAASPGVSTGPSSSVAQHAATAPLPEEHADLDDDGFERYEEEQSATPSTSSFLPAPPARLEQRFSSSFAESAPQRHEDGDAFADARAPALDLPAYERSSSNTTPETRPYADAKRPIDSPRTDVHAEASAPMDDDDEGDLYGCEDRVGDEDEDSLRRP